MAAFTFRTKAIFLPSEDGGDSIVVNGPSTDDVWAIRSVHYTPESVEIQYYEIAGDQSYPMVLPLTHPLSAQLQKFYPDGYDSPAEEWEEQGGISQWQSM